MQNVFVWLRNGAARDAAVDGSSTPVVFEYESTEDSFYVHRLIVSMVDTGTFDAALYGNGIILTNGIKIEVTDTDGSTIALDLLDGETLKTNGDWAGLCHDYVYLDIGSGDNVATVRWTFTRGGLPLKLDAGMKFQVTIQDNLVGLTSHYFQLQGVQE